MIDCVFFVAKSFVEMTRFLLKCNDDEKGDLFLLSERISQDSLENYYGKQRARGGRNTNPTLQQCLTNAGALRIQKSMALDPVRGNYSRKRNLEQSDLTAAAMIPLPKRRSKCLH